MQTDAATPLGRSIRRALLGFAWGCFFGLLALDIVAVGGSVEGPRGLLSLGGYAGLVAAGLTLALGLPAALAAALHQRLRPRRIGRLLLALMVSLVPALGIAWALGRLLRATHFSELGSWNLIVAAGQIGVVAISALGGLIARRLVETWGRPRRGALFVRFATLMLLMAAAYGLALADRRLFVRHYPDLHLVLGGLALVAAGLAGALLATFSRRQPPEKLLWCGALLILLLGSAAFFRKLPDDAPRVSRLVGLDAPITAKIVLLLPAQGRRTEEVVEAGYLEALEARPEIPAARLDALFPQRRDFNLVLISIDTLRADRVGHLGYERKTTPNLDALADESVVFERTYAQYPSSQLSMASMFSGLYPGATQAHVVRDEMDRIPGASGDVMLVHRMTEAKRSTRAVTALPRPLIDRLFGHLRDGYAEFSDAGEGPYTPADVVTNRALKALPSPEEGPHFTWLHYFDPHQPYHPHDDGPDFGDRSQDLYDGEIHFADRHLGRLFKALRARSDWDRTVVVVHSDHGEEFRDHGGLAHHSSVYREQLHVPLLLRVPGLAPGRIDTPVELVDLVPTLLALMDIHPEERLNGHDLLPLIMDGPEAGPAPYAWAQILQATPGTGRQEAVRSRDWCLVHRLSLGLEELYDLRTDAAEKRDLRDARPEELAEMRRWRAAFRAYMSGDGTRKARVNESDDLIIAAKSQDLAVAQPALRALARGGYHRALEEVYRGILADPRRAALHSNGLAWLARERVPGIEEILVRFARDKRPHIRVQVFREFGVLGVRGHDELLRETSTSDELWPAFFASCARAMLGDRTVIEDVRSSFFRVTGFNRLYPVMGLAVLDEPSAYPLLHGGLSSGNLPWPIGGASLELLSRTKKPEALLAVYPRFSPGIPSALQLRTLSKALPNFAAEDALPLYRVAVGSTDPELRHWAETTLTALGHEAWIETLRRNDDAVRAAVEEATAKRFDRAVERLVAAAARSRDEGLEDWALLHEAWRHLVIAGQRERAAEILAESKARLPSFVQTFRKRLARLTQARKRAPQARLSWLFFDKKVEGSGGAWCGGVNVSLSNEGGSLLGADFPGFDSLVFRLRHDEGKAKTEEHTFAFPTGGILPGETVPLLLPIVFGDLAPGTWKLEINVQSAAGRIGEPLTLDLQRKR